jgi:hypothetical protein
MKEKTGKGRVLFVGVQRAAPAFRINTFAALIERKKDEGGAFKLKPPPFERRPGVE